MFSCAGGSGRNQDGELGGARPVEAWKGKGSGGLSEGEDPTKPTKLTLATV